MHTTQMYVSNILSNTTRLLIQERTWMVCGRRRSPGFKAPIVTLTEIVLFGPIRPELGEAESFSKIQKKNIWDNFKRCWLKSDQVLSKGCL